MRSALGAAGLAAALLLSGCSGGDDSVDVAPQPAASGPSRSTSGPAPAGSSSSSAPSDDAAGTEQSPVTGTRQVKDASGGAAVQVDVRGLHRDGRLLRLDYSVTNLSGARLFVPDVVPPLNPEDVYLLDSEGLKKYLVVRDSKNRPAYQPVNVYLRPSEVFQASAYFAAPSVGVTALRLNFAALGGFDTPVS